MSTICAVSTPNAAGGISVIRISGENAVSVAAKIFFPFSKKPVSEMNGHTCAYGEVFFDGKKIDDAVLTVFLAPKSYTGENTAEISCHGGIFVTREVLRACLKSGAELAEPGEFTKRAFLNGKLSLPQAESVMDIISAEGGLALKSANRAHDGALYKKIKEASDRLVSLLGELAAWVDYPEEDLPEVGGDAMRNTLLKVDSSLEKILSDYDRGVIVREGIDTVIAGRANVGKSSLMNMLLGFDRSIVTDVAGTTRDLIEESARLGDVVLRLSDTAGIRETSDKVESIGVGMAKKKISSASLVLAVFDASEKLSDTDKELLDEIKDKKAVIILNKTDLAARILKKDFLPFGKEVVEISAKNKTGLDELQKAVEKLFMLSEAASDMTVFANERQKLCVEKASLCLKDAVKALDAGETLDAVTVIVTNACDSLLELNGEKASQAVVDEVFKNFCVGK